MEKAQYGNKNNASDTGDNLDTATDRNICDRQKVDDMFCAHKPSPTASVLICFAFVFIMFHVFYIESYDLFSFFTLASKFSADTKIIKRHLKPDNRKL